MLENDGTHDWMGKAFCVVAESRPEYDGGSRGAYVVIACRASDIIHAISLVSSELQDNGLCVRGFEYLLDTKYIDRALSAYEQDLQSMLGAYPVQFENVHFFKPDS